MRITIVSSAIFISLYILLRTENCSLFFLSGKNASQRMLDIAHQLINCGKSQGILRNDVRVLGARQVTQTASPGHYLYMQIKDWPEWSNEP